MSPDRRRPDRKTPVVRSRFNSASEQGHNQFNRVFACFAPWGAHVGNRGAGWNIVGPWHGYPFPFTSDNRSTRSLRRRSCVPAVPRLGRLAALVQEGFEVGLPKQAIAIRRVSGNRSRGLSQFSRRSPRKWDCPLGREGDRHIFRPATVRKMSQSPGRERLRFRCMRIAPALPHDRTVPYEMPRIFASSSTLTQVSPTLIPKQSTAARNPPSINDANVTKPYPKRVIVHAVSPLVMPDGTARQRADNCHLEGGIRLVKRPPPSRICQNVCVCRAADWFTSGSQGSVFSPSS